MKFFLNLLPRLVVVFVSFTDITAASSVNDFDADFGKIPTPFSVPDVNADDSSSSTSSAGVIEETTIAICGGGLTGLAVAIGLDRNGIDCRVYERAPQLRSVSQGMLAVQPNGLEALEQIHPDLPASVAKAGCELQQTMLLTTTSDSETPKSRIRSGLHLDSMEKYGRIPILIQWHQLQKCLAAVVLGKQIVVTGRSLVSFEEFDDHVLLSFEDGSQVKCQAMLSCEGTFSRSRQQMLSNDNDKPIYFGQLNWNAIVPTSDELMGITKPDSVIGISHHGNEKEPRRWFAFVNDCGCHQTFWQLRLVDPEKAMAMSGSSGRGGLGLEGIKDALRTVASPSKELWKAIEQTPEAQIFERCIIGRRPAETWLSPRGRVALVGDAAHAMHPNVGQGGNSAFESSWAVVDALKRCNLDYVAGLKQYEAKRKPRADLVQRFSNLMGCVQSTGSSFLNEEARAAIEHWIKQSKAVEDLDLSSDQMKILLEFDPCSLSHVTLLDY